MNTGAAELQYKIERNWSSFACGIKNITEAKVLMGANFWDFADVNWEHIGQYIYRNNFSSRKSCICFMET